MGSHHVIASTRSASTKRVAPKLPKLSTQRLQLPSNAIIKTRNPSLCSDRSAPIVPSHC